MKTRETDPRLWNWVNVLLNSWPFCIHEEATATIFTIAWDALGWYRPENSSLFYNGYFMLRVMFPFGLWVHIKPRINTRIQFGLGWKGNGRIGLTFRVQTDEEAAAGVLGPNHGQAVGWERGTA